MGKNNVIIVSTTRTNGRAWCAWRIADSKINDIEYIVSDNNGERTVYRANSYIQGKFVYIQDEFVNHSDLRYAFDLTNISDTPLGKRIIRESSGTRANSGVVYFSL